MIDILKFLPTEDRTQLENACEGRAKAVHLGDHRVLCRVLSKYMMVVDGRDNGVAPHLIISGYWEFWAAQAVSRFVKPGMRCIDLGANFGYYTLLLGHLVGDAGYVQAWEPADFARDCLRRTIELNGLESRVEIVAAAASNASIEDGGARLVQESATNLGAMSVAAHDAIGQPIGCARVDEMWHQRQPPDFLKIDIEGHEVQAWEGMDALLAAPGRRAILIEYSPHRYAEPRAFLDRMRGAGYRINTLKGDGHPEAVTDLDALAARRDFELLWLEK